MNCAIGVEMDHRIQILNVLQGDLVSSSCPSRLLSQRRVGRSPLRWRHSLTEFFLSQLWSKTVLLRFYANCYRDLRDYFANVGQWRK
jgi:hypothetical protein